MTDLYAAVDSAGETVGTFSALDKAKAAVEVKIIDDVRDGYYGHRYKEGPPPPPLTWQEQEGGVHVCGFVRGGGYFNDPVQWRRCEPVIHTIELDPSELP